MTTNNIKIFEDYNKFKEFILKLTNNDINNNYQYIELKNIEDLYIEDNIDFNGDLILNQCKIRKIKGCFNINSLTINGCKNLYLIDLYTSIKKLTINFKYTHRKTFKIIGNYLDLKNININYRNKNKYYKKVFYFNGKFNKDIIIEGDDINYITFNDELLNIKNKIKVLNINRIDVLENINKIKEIKCENIVFNNCKNIIGDFSNFDKTYINYISNTNIIGNFNNINILNNKKQNNLNIICNVLYIFKFNNKFYNGKSNINISGNYNIIDIIGTQNINFNNCNIKGKLIISHNNNLSKLYNCNFKDIKNLELKNCKDTNFLLNNSNNLINLEKLRLSCCEKINEIPNNLINLKELLIDDDSYLINTNNTIIIPDNLINLQKLSIKYCRRIKELPKTLINLQFLELYYCNNLKELPNNLWNIYKLIIEGCKYLKKQPILKKNNYKKIQNI